MKNSSNPFEGIFDLDIREKELEEIDTLMSQPEFWSKDQEETSRVSQQRAQLLDTLGSWNAFQRQIEDARLLADMAEEEGDSATLEEVGRDISRLEKDISALDLQSLLDEPDDRRNAILSINAGAGGTEAQDWAEMLLRMYLRWCESRGYQTRTLDHQPGEEAGIKSATITVTGPNAYGFLKSEHGIHRMVRVSPFDATGRRHTSFASVSVVPEVDTDIMVEINENDLRIDTYRASGPGGQHVNKTSSAIRITHIPTGIVVQCQNEKSQHRNREMAIKVLTARLYELEKRRQDEKKQEMHDSQKDIAWGSQIRSYVFNPYRIVKDHRTAVEVGDLERVMNGDIQPFVDAYLRGRKGGGTLNQETAQCS